MFQYYPAFGRWLPPGIGGGMRNFGSRRNRVRNPWFVIFALDLVQRIVDLPRKPPLTLGLMAGMAALYLTPEIFGDILGAGAGNDGVWGANYRKWVYGGYSSHIQELCLMPGNMLEDFQRTGALGLRRFFWSAFLHGSEMHLYYNMASFLLKGISLELDMGTRAYSGLLAFCLIASQALHIAASWLLLVMFEDSSAMTACTVGFSGVLFALKYVLHRRSPGYTRVLGLKIHTRYAAWLELVLIHFLVPNASFLGHLTGILAGILYVEVPGIASVLNLLAVSLFGNPRPSYTYSSGTTGHRTPPPTTRNSYQRQYGSGAAGSHDYVGDDAEEEAFQEALRRSRLDTGLRRGAVADAGSTRSQQGWMEQEAETSPSVESYRAAPSAPPASPEMDVSSDATGGRGDLSATELRRRRLKRMSVDL